MMGVALIAAKLRGANRQKRPQAFSARPNQMLRQIWNEANRGLHAIKDERIYGRHVIARQIPQGLCRGEGCILLYLRGRVHVRGDHHFYSCYT